MTDHNPVLLIVATGPAYGVYHLQSGCYVGILRNTHDARAYSTMIRPWLRNVVRYDDIPDRWRRALAIQLRGWLVLNNYPPYTHCPCCNKWAILCDRSN
jgi:hypothetical protein